MALVVVVVFSILFLLIKSIEHTYYKNMLRVFLAYWGISLFISTFNPYGLNEVTATTYVLLLAGVISFVLGAIINKPVKTNASKSISIGVFIDKLVSSKYFILLLIVIDLFLIWLYLKFAALLLYTNAVDIRKDMNLIYEGNGAMALFYSIFIKPFDVVVMFIGAYLLLFKRTKILPLVLIIINLTLSSLIANSRGSLFIVLIYIVMVYFCKNELFASVGKNGRNSRQFFLIALISLLVFVGMGYMTNQRYNNDNTFDAEAIYNGLSVLGEEFVTYSVGPFRAFDYALNNNYVELLGGHTFGACTFGFVDTFLQLVFRKLGLAYTADVNNVVGYLQESYITIGKDNIINFVYTENFLFYMDFGVLGVVFCSYFFGFLSSSAAKGYNKKKNPFLLILVSYMLYQALYGMSTWGFYRYTSFFTLLFIFLLYKVTQKSFRKL